MSPVQIRTRFVVLLSETTFKINRSAGPRPSSEKFAQLLLGEGIRVTLIWSYPHESKGIPHRLPPSRKEGARRSLMDEKTVTWAGEPDVLLELRRVLYRAMTFMNLTLRRGFATVSLDTGGISRAASDLCPRVGKPVR